MSSLDALYGKVAKKKKKKKAKAKGGPTAEPAPSPAPAADAPAAAPATAAAPQPVGAAAPVPQTGGGSSAPPAVPPQGGAEGAPEAKFEDEADDTGDHDAAMPLAALSEALLSRVPLVFGNTLSKFGRDLFLIDGDALLGYLIAEEPVRAAASAASAAVRAAEEAAVGLSTGAAPVDTAGHPVFDFQTLPLVFRVEQFLTHLFELGAEFRVVFMQAHASGWTPPYALLRQIVVWHLRNCTSFVVDTEVVHPWHESWKDYVSLHLPSYILGCTDWDWPTADSIVLPRTGLIARAFTLSLLAEGRSVVLLRGVAQGNRVDVGSARFDAYWLSRISGATLLRRVGPASTFMSRVRAEVLPGALTDSGALPGSLTTPAPAWEHGVLCTDALRWGGWRLAVAVDAAALYLNDATAHGDANNASGGVKHRVALAALFLWHAVAMQHLPVEQRAIPSAGLPLGGLNAEVELGETDLAAFVHSMSRHLRTALTSAGCAHKGTDATDDDAAADAGVADSDRRPTCMAAGPGQATANAADLLDARLLRFLHVVLPRAIAAASGASPAAVAASVLGGRGAGAAGSALAAAWAAVASLVTGDAASAVASFDICAPSPLAGGKADADKFVKTVTAAADAAMLPEPVIAPCKSALSSALLGNGDITQALAAFERPSSGNPNAFPFGDSYCWHQGSDFAKLPEAFDKVREQASATKKVLTDRERRTLQRKANAVALKGASLAGGVVDRKTIIVKGIWSEADQARIRAAELAAGKTARKGGKKGKKGGAKAPKGGWSTGKKGKTGGAKHKSRADQIKEENRNQAKERRDADARKQLASLEATVAISVNREKFEDAISQLDHFKAPPLKGEMASEDGMLVNMEYQAARLEVLLAWQQWTMRRIAMGKGDAQEGLGSWSSSPASVLYVVALSRSRAARGRGLTIVCLAVCGVCVASYAAASDAMGMFPEPSLISRLQIVLVQIFTLLGFTEVRDLVAKNMDPATVAAIRLPETNATGRSVSKFQLNEGGAEMPRSVNSREDDRTDGFNPDGWQADLLDIVDDRESALVVAPTSSGKTFICFYAMERVLEQDNEGVLVYVAPTKQLVNQVVAEVYGRFEKKYRGGTQLAGVFTRDYQYNVDTCQILVTVPERAEILLMSAAYVRTPALRWRCLALCVLTLWLCAVCCLPSSVPATAMW